MSETQQTQGVRTVWWEEERGGAVVRLLDQSLLPQEVVYLRLTSGGAGCGGHQDAQGARRTGHRRDGGFRHGAGSLSLVARTR